MAWIVKASSWNKCPMNIFFDVLIKKFTYQGRRKQSVDGQAQLDVGDEDVKFAREARGKILDLAQSGGAFSRQV